MDPTRVKGVGLNAKLGAAASATSNLDSWLSAAPRPERTNPAPAAKRPRKAAPKMRVPARDEDWPDVGFDYAEAATERAPIDLCTQ